MRPLTGLVLKFACCLTAASGMAQDISISQMLDRAEMAFEDTARYEITLTWQGPQWAYRFDRPLQPDFDRLKVQRYSSSITSSGSGTGETTTKVYQFELIPTLAGRGHIYPVTVEYLRWPDSIPGQLTTEAMAVSIAEPVPVTVADEGGFGWWWLILVIVVLGGGAGGAIVMMKRRSVGRQPVRIPRDQFLENLEILKRESGPDLKKFQTGLYRYLVRYLSDEFQLELSGCSTVQISDRLRDTSMIENHRNQICGWLERAEREKFSPTAPAPGETIRLESEVRRFFERL